MPRTWVSGTFWPRTGCVLDGTGNLTCQTGQCGTPGKVDCGFGNNGATPQNPASQFEVTTAPGTGNYDVSLNAGYNVQTKITPVGGSHLGAACAFAGCTRDLNATCPAALQVISNGSVVGCLDPCTRCQRPNPADLTCNNPITVDASGHQPSNTTNCMGQVDGLPTYLDMYCAKNMVDGNAQASSNQGTDTAFSQADCAVGKLFTTTGFPPSYTLPPGQGVCIDPNNPNYANAMLTCGAATVGQPCGGYLFGSYANALGYTCQPVTANGITAYACLPPTTSGLGQCIGGSPPLYNGVGGVTNAAWITAGIQAGGGTTPYYQTFKAACPAAYTWQYDDAASGFACEGFTGFNIDFCGAVAGGPRVDRDFNGDGKSDILWLNSSSGNVAVWLMNGGSVLSSFGLGNAAGWTSTVGDFNGDRIADILWQNTASGNVALWFMNANGTVQSSIGLGNLAGWTPTVGDFNGDGIADILWQNTASGNAALWFMNGNGTVQSSAGLGNLAGWTPTVGDFNGDAIADILWQNTASGNAALWFMNGNGTVQSSTGLGNLAGWTPAVGDFNGDGVADILWQNTAGNAALWFMNANGTVQSSAGLGNLAGWTPRVGDFNGDGIADILWQNTASGNVALWLMNGNGTVQSSIGLGSVPGWTTQ